MNTKFLNKLLILILCTLFLGALNSCDDKDALTNETAQEETNNFRSKAGFIEIEPITYYLDQKGRKSNTQKFKTSLTKIWYSLQIADVAPETKPLFVFFNGGPGSSTGLLFTYNTSKFSLDPVHNGGGEIGPNPYSWTAMGNLLYIDARQTGFSYSLFEIPNVIFETGEYSKRNFNPFIDGADFVRVVLRILSQNPEIKSNRVILVGESYGGIRACVMLNYLLYYNRYNQMNDFFYDPALVDEIQTHLESVFPEYKGRIVPPEVIATQFGHQVLIQPFIAGHIQENLGAQLLTETGSPLQHIAEEKGLAFNRCEKESPELCNPIAIKTNLINEADVDPYHISYPSGFTSQKTKGRLKLTEFEILKQMICMDPRQIKDLYAYNRIFARRSLLESAVATTLSLNGDLWRTFGRLTASDAYYVSSSVTIYPLNLLPTSMFNPVFGRMFLENIPFVETMITNAKWDSVCYAPAIPASFCDESYADMVERVDETNTSFRITFKEDAFPEHRVDPIDIYMPNYVESGHSVSVFEPKKLFNDVSSWTKRTTVFNENARQISD